MVRELAPRVQELVKEEHVNTKDEQKLTGFSGDFRHDLKVLLQVILKTREDLYKLDQAALANESRVKDLYVSEYGPISDVKVYLNNAIRIIQSVAFEVSLGFPYVPDDKIEQKEI